MPKLDLSGLTWPTKFAAEAYQRAQDGEIADAATAKFYLAAMLRNPKVFHRPPLPVFKRDPGDHADVMLCAAENTLPLTIVTVSRNDNHVERMAERTQAFIDAIYYLAEQYGKPVELIIVEWNPPADRHMMADAFDFPKSHPLVSTLIVTVPKEIHETFALSADLPLYQMIGKNVGIRRSRGRFVLATNIDVLLEPALFQLMVEGQLEAGHIYRSNRWDVDRSILDLEDSAARLAAARELCFQINWKGTTLPKRTEADQSAPDPQSDTEVPENYGIPDCHYIACGDFQLLHRDDWVRLRGYWELDGFSMHLDSAFAISTYRTGIKEYVFDNRLPVPQASSSLARQAAVLLGSGFK